VLEVPFLSADACSGSSRSGKGEVLRDHHSVFDDAEDQCGQKRHDDREFHERGTGFPIAPKPAFPASGLRRGFHDALNEISGA
jgi:hypothetical protein